MAQGGRLKPPNFRIEYPGDIQVKQRIHGKLNQIKAKMIHGLDNALNNTALLENVLDSWLETQRNGQLLTNGYVPVTDDNKDENIYMVTQSSLSRYTEMVQEHSRMCSGDIHVHTMTRKGHVALTKLRCNKKKGRHSLTWSSSPYLANGQYLINHRVFHGFSCSGMLPVHYKRICEGANIGWINNHSRANMVADYHPKVSRLSAQSQELALQLEIGSYYDEGEEVIEHDSDNELDIRVHPGIDVETDARHGWRKNAKDTSVVCLGSKTHKFIRHDHVTKRDDPVSQRHEVIGCRRVFEHLEEIVPVNIHAHDRNLSINLITRNETNAINQNDTWHGVKSVKKVMKLITTGAQKRHGKTWHRELQDKMEPICTHFHWAIRNCGGDPDELKRKLDNITQHYCNVHAN